MPPFLVSAKDVRRILTALEKHLSLIPKNTRFVA
nr:MAG TPA: hypothetical protein [Caudoviricetes sp.]